MSPRQHRHRSPDESRGTPKLSFRAGALGALLDRRIDATPDATSRAQVAQRDLGRYYALLDAGRREIRRLGLTEAQCSALCDVLNGTLILGLRDPSRPEPEIWPESIVTAISAELHDAEGLGEKWQVNIPALVQRLGELSPLGAWALVDAIEQWWVSPDLSEATTAELHRAVGLIA